MKLYLLCSVSEVCTNFKKVYKKKWQLILTVFFLLYINSAFAGAGAFFTIANNSPYRVTINAYNTSPTNSLGISAWNVAPFWDLGTLLLPYQSLTEYIEANNAYWGSSNATAHIVMNVQPYDSTDFESVDVYIPFAEDQSNYSIGTMTGVTNPHFNIISTFDNSGSQSTVTISIYPSYSGTNAASWMTSNLYIQNSSLSQITVPGAHDAAMSNSGPCTIFANACNTQTQIDDFYTMLVNDGVRNFDCRPVIWDSTLTNYLGHFGYVGGTANQMVTAANVPFFLVGAMNSAITEVAGTDIPANIPVNNQGCIGMRLDTALAQVKRFLTNKSLNNQHEVIVMDFSHFMDIYKYDAANSNFDSSDAVNFFTQITDSLQGYLYPCNCDNIFSIPISTITANGPKVIVLIDPSDITGNLNNIVNGVTGTTGIYPEQYMNSTSYADTNNVNAMANIEFGTMNKGYTGYSYRLMSWTLTENSIQNILCVLGPDILNIIEKEAISWAGGVGMTLGLIGGIYKGYTAGAAVNTFNQQNPYVSILDLASQANNSLYLIPEACSSSSGGTENLPNVIYGDGITPALINIVYSINMVRVVQ